MLEESFVLRRDEGMNQHRRKFRVARAQPGAPGQRSGPDCRHSRAHSWEAEAGRREAIPTTGSSEQNISTCSEKDEARRKDNAKPAYPATLEPGAYPVEYSPVEGYEVGQLGNRGREVVQDACVHASSGNGAALKGQVCFEIFLANDAGSDVGFDRLSQRKDHFGTAASAGEARPRPRHC